MIRKQIYFTYVAILLTTLCLVLSGYFAINIFFNNINNYSYYDIFLKYSFFIIIGFFYYSAYSYFLCRLGYWKRKKHFLHKNHEIPNIFFLGKNVPKVTYLIPSYKEDIRTIKQTVLSAALQEYPNKYVVILIDNPPNTQDANDVNLLISTRKIPQEIQALLAPMFKQIQKKYNRFLEKSQTNKINLVEEVEIVINLCIKVAIWFEQQAEENEAPDHAEKLMIEKFFTNQYKSLIQIADCFKKHKNRKLISLKEINILYQKLICIFDVKVSSFERKIYNNLSHKRNKAMNLNSFIALMGKKIKKVDTEKGLYIVNHQQGELLIPDSDYVIILDADSIILPSYTQLLTYFMEQPQNQKCAVIQTPYCSYPNAPGILERIASATTDIQHIIHQGLTFYDATYWVGANAMVRKTALNSIMTTRKENGFTIKVYIQDRTVIEDTESTIDLLNKGWKLYNYFDILSYSATPHNFAALVIQRQRWANGGLLIVPKLIKYLITKPKKYKTLCEVCLRFFYLISLPTINLAILLLLLYSFEEEIASFSTLLMLFVSLFYYYLYILDLQYMGYKKTDVIGVLALNIMLVPINISGFFKSIIQMIIGKQATFIRTPKARHKSSIPLFFIFIEYGLWLYSGIAFLKAFWHQEWLGLTYSLINFVLFTYAIKAFIKYYPSTLLKEIFKNYNLKR